MILKFSLLRKFLLGQLIFLHIHFILVNFNVTFGDYLFSQKSHLLLEHFLPVSCFYKYPEAVYAQLLYYI